MHMTALTHDEIEEFLNQSKWLRRLGQRLVAGDDAQEVVQETWVQFAAHPPRHADAPRGWLAQVARNVSRMRKRGGTRRAAREAAVDPGLPPLDPEELLSRSRLFRQLAELVEDLDDPYRSVVLLHFFEDVPLAEIARRTGTPAGTVRWRLKVALERLRTALDDAHRGNREAWMSAFAPLCSIPEHASAATIGAAAHGTAGKIVALVASTVVVAGAGAAMLHGARSSTESQPQAGASSKARVADRSDEPTASAAARPTLPRRSSSNRPLFTSSAEHADAVAAVQAARLERLRKADVGDETVVQAAARDAQLLGAIEEMMLLEDASIIARACADAAAPHTRGISNADIVFIGEADVGVVIESVAMNPPPDGGRSEFTTCLTESLFMLSLAPPPIGGGSQHLRLFFDFDGEDITVGKATDPEAAPE
jgi:RNA polymerase sigma-70 factor (ECF subfamily)